MYRNCERSQRRDAGSNSHWQSASCRLVRMAAAVGAGRHVVSKAGGPAGAVGIRKLIGRAARAFRVLGAGARPCVAVGTAVGAF